MKKIIQFLNNIWLFFWYKTKKGKEDKYFKEASDNIEALLKGKAKVKTECVASAKNWTDKKKLSKFHLATVTSKKHEKELVNNKVKIHPRTLEFKDA